MELFEPWPVGYKVNPRNGYGPRVHPITGQRGKMHHGVDVAMPTGTPLTAPADGVVVHKNKSASAGYNLILRHEGTWHTVYYHLQKPSPLKLGAVVKAGELIAWSGNTGHSTGPHLHWELRKTRKWGDTVDPMPYVVGPFVPPEPVAEPEPVIVELDPVTPTPRPQPVKPKPRPQPVKPTPRPPLIGAGHGYNHSAQAAHVGILQSFLNKWKGRR